MGRRLRLVRKVSDARSYVGVWHVFVPASGRTACRRWLRARYRRERIEYEDLEEVTAREACLVCARLEPALEALVTATEERR